MKVIVLYDSFFGNTERIAQAVSRALGESLGSEDEITTVRVGSVTPAQLSGLALLVVGSPTRGFKPSEGTAAFLKSIPAGSLNGVKVASFDTRFNDEKIKSSAFFLPWLVKRFGFAADPIGKQLTEKGGTLVVPPEGFFVGDTEGPLLDGELERAAEWAKGIQTVFTSSYA